MQSRAESNTANQLCCEQVFDYHFKASIPTGKSLIGFSAASLLCICSSSNLSKYMLIIVDRMSNLHLMLWTQAVIY